MRLFPILAAFALLPASPALADWTYARWGMSPAQVVAASNGQARLAPPSKNTNTVYGTTGAEADYSQPPFDFAVTFGFRYDKLTQVTLHVKDGKDCTPLANDLIRKFGPPVIKSFYTDVTGLFWPDTATANDIRVLRTSSACSIIYIQHGVVAAPSPEGRARFDNLSPGPSQRTKPSKSGSTPKAPQPDAAPKTAKP